MRAIKINGTKVKIWARSLDIYGWEQVMNMSKLPFLSEQGISLMPDAHAGTGVPIGTVLPCIKAVIPTAVGNDAGCGMRAMKTNICVEEISQDTLKKVIMRGIRKRIMIGDMVWKEPQPENQLPQGWDFDSLPALSANKGWKLATRSMASQGGGNHFEELQKDEDGYLWVMIHSGSRGLGGRVYMYYNQLAKNLNAKYHSMVTEDMYLPFLPKGTPEFDSYLREMQYCLEWAQCNRQEMMNRTKEVLLEAFSRAEFGEEIDINHNYVALERHGGLDLYVHRKGAVCTGDTITDENGTTSFTPNTVIIPGSMGTCSYICSGIQSEEAFNSCSHGAGRALSRTEARQLDIKAEVEMLDSLGIVHGIRIKQDLEECPSAYKDINQVLQDGADLVNPIVKLTPIAVLKG